MLTWISGPSMKPYLSPLCTASSQLSVQVYDPVSQCWSTGPAMLSTRGHACCIGVNSSSGLASRVFVIGKRETNFLSQWGTNYNFSLKYKFVKTDIHFHTIQDSELPPPISHWLYPSIRRVQSEQTLLCWSAAIRDRVDFPSSYAQTKVQHRQSDV